MFNLILNGPLIDGIQNVSSTWLLLNESRMNTVQSFSSKFILLQIRIAS